MIRTTINTASVLAATGLLASIAWSGQAAAADSCAKLSLGGTAGAIHNALQTALETVVAAANNGGLKNDMWATLVDQDGIVCAVAFTGDTRNNQWPGSRVI